VRLSLISGAFERATDILSCNRNMLNETAEKLLEEESLSGDQLPTPVWEPQEGSPQVSSIS